MRLLTTLLVLAMIASSCSSGGDNEAEPQPTATPSSTPTDDPPLTTPVATTGTSTLSLRLSAGEAITSGAGDPTRVVSGTPLDEDTVEAIIERLPAWTEPGDSRTEFNRPPETLPPPLVGETISETFPAAGAADGGPPDPVSGPLEVLRFQPEGPVDIAPSISITFNQPMVPLATLEQLNELDVPVNLTPDVAGSWQWIGTRTLRFEHDSDLIDRLPMATEYRVEIPAGTRSMTGGVLAETVAFEFDTPPVTVRSFAPTGNSLQLDPIFVVTFDQRVDPRAIISITTLSAAGDQRQIKLATDAEIAADESAQRLVDRALDGRWVAFRPVEPLPKDSEIRIRIGPAIPSTEGPLTNDSVHTESHRTYAPLRVLEADCWYDEQCPPYTPWRIVFNNILDPEAFDPSTVRIEPELPGASIQAQGTTLTIQGPSKGRIDYEVTLPASLTDVFGQTLGRDVEVEFDVGAAPPLLRGFGRRLITLDPIAGTPTLGVSTINHDELDVTAYRVAPEDWLTFRDYFDDFYDYYEDPDDRPRVPNWPKVYEARVDANSEDDAFEETAIDLSDAFDGEPGHLVVLVEPTGRLARLTREDNDYWQNRSSLAWVQSTAIGVDAFADDDSLVVWATDLATGEPMAGVDIELSRTRSTGTTDSDGLARISLASTSDGRLVARKGGDSVLVLSETSSWERVDRDDQARWYVLDDRQVYRPGETANIKGWIRKITFSDDAQLELIGRGGTVSYLVRDYQGNEIADGTASVNALGGFDFSFEIDENANLGDAWIDLQLSGASSLSSRGFGHSIQIQEFRRPEFEVTARNESVGPYFNTTPATVAVEATYFSGGPLPAAPVSWTVSTSDATYTPPGWSDFSFGVWTPWWYFNDYFYGDGYYESDFYYDEFDCCGFDQPEVEQFDGVTDSSGNHYLQIDFEGDNELPVTVSAQATVFDVNRQAWASQTDLLVHPAEVYVGMRSTRTFVKKGDPMDIELIVADVDGEPRAGHSIHVEAQRLDWQYREGEYVEVVVEAQECDVTSELSPVTCSFDTDNGGELKIVATVADEDGQVNRSELTRWISGGRAQPTRNVEQEEATLVPDRAEYQPGDVAEVLVQSPFGPAEGLLTIARNGIEQTEQFTLSDGTAVLTIDIDDRHIPNLHVRVDLVGAAERTADDGAPLPNVPPRPAFATGSVTLVIPPVSRTLSVDVTPAAPELEPGDRTEVNVRVVDSDGSPVESAELAVVVVDEAVLALSDYQLQDPVGIFYSTIQPGVSSDHSRRSIVLTDPDQLGTGGAGDDSLGDGAGGAFDEEAADQAAAEPSADAGLNRSSAATASNDTIEVRSNFDALAVFAPDVATDSNGMATIPVPLPDNLTRYRIMVVAVDGADQFGSGESNLTARLPLMVRPSAPRFLNFGDVFELPVILQNQTDDVLEVDVVAQTANLGLTAGAGRRVSVPANDRIEVRFPAQADEAGTAAFRVAAVSGSLSDAASSTLPVYTPATTEAFATYGVVDSGAVAQPILTPEGVFPQFGGLEVNTSSTAVQALTDAVLYLSEYPYRSSDAYASRIIAIASLRDILDAFEADGLPSPEELEDTVANDIEGLLSLQNFDGGFGFWRSRAESWPYNSIQATHALVVARENGYTVAEEPYQRALQYLASIEDYMSRIQSQRTRDMLSAYALHVRQLAGDRDTNKAEALYRRGGSDLSLDALAWLWPVISSSAIDSAIERTFSNQTTETAAGATFVTDYGEDAYLVLHSDRRTDGVVLDALISVRPDSDLIPKVVEGLLGHRTKGRWNNVQENSFILLALNNYFDTFEAQEPDFVARVWLGDLYAAEHEFAGRTTDRRETLIPMEEVIAEGDSRLIISKDGPGRLYYRLGLSYAPEDLELDPLDRGFVVTRTYEAVDEAEDVWRDSDGIWHVRAGAEVRVRLTMVADSRRTHVALIDPLPAGLETLNPALAVTPDVPADPADRAASWWYWTWYSHQNLRDDRAEAFTDYLWAGTFDYTYVARATTPGTFVVPPSKAEEMYHPETFGRSAGDILVVEADTPG